MDPAIRQALTWTILGISVVMTLFTWVDLSEGSAGTATWISGFAWPLVGVISGVILRKDPFRSSDAEE